MFDKILIANRGEIACRVLRSCKRLGIASVAVYSEIDADSPHVRDADQAICIGSAKAQESYLDIERVLAAAKQSGAQAIHPGYGFLSESAAFASACERATVVFIGPSAEQIRRFGLKHEARALALEHGVPLLPGTELLPTPHAARSAAAQIGYPVMLKSTAGGGGIGLRVCHDAAALDEAFAAVHALSTNHFGASGVFLEQYLEAARHIEIQIFGDGRGHVLALGERDCSVQRRNQKVIEETPAPHLTEATRAQMTEAALRLARAVRYASAGTVEFVVDAERERCYFLEVNTRLQVEHGVTEAVTGIDLVEWMIRQAAGELELPKLAPKARGAAIEVRVYAEDPHKNFQPSTGTLMHVALPNDVRCDGWVENGSAISPYYDPLLVKLIAHGENREHALARLRAALARTVLDGLETNLEYLRQILGADTFERGRATTRFLASFVYAPRTIDVIDAGTQTTVQDYPGRLGGWAVGVPPSGPMDDYALRRANRILGNREAAPGLELTLAGPCLRFNCDTELALTGADFGATLDGIEIACERLIAVRAGARLELGAVRGAGARAYLAVRGGLAVTPYLGSAATFMLGRFGGHGGRALRSGDVLHLGPESSVRANEIASERAPASYPELWEIAVLYGPHGAPDFFTLRDIETFFATSWEVHYNSDRTGIRLIGPRPEWARKDGGEAGLHPSNIHDNAYAIATIDYTGDMPIILGLDGPSLGGFVCPATIVRAERWKLGQLKAGDRVRFVRVDEATALELFAARERELLRCEPPRASVPKPPLSAGREDCVLDVLAARDDRPRVVYRRAGDDYLLVEYGPLELELGLRFRVHLLMRALEQQKPRGVLELTPGIRSLQIRYAPELVSSRSLLALLTATEADLPRVSEIEVPTRIVHLPLSWEDPATLLAIEKYTRVVRKDAPWCPSNIEFIRRINGLASRDEVRRIVLDASYLVLGLGDVYLGAPVATPIDPRHRLVTTKYNPARTWTPENAVGIGGAYLCIYGMEGPGGYQFVGRTLQVWNTHRVTGEFAKGSPWLLRFFDQIRFYPVSAEELLQMRAAFPQGKLRLAIEEETFRFAEYREFLAANAASIAAFKAQQERAFLEERERWAAAGQDVVTAAAPEASRREHELAPLGPRQRAVTSPLAGSVWKLLVAPGEHVQPDTHVAVIEAMKTEISIKANHTGRVASLCQAPGAPVLPGDRLVLLDV